MNPLAVTPTFFDTVERRSLLLSAAHAWRGTPFFANSSAPGRDGGVDCVRLLRAIYVATGVLAELPLPAYRMDHGQHSSRSLLIEAFETWPELTSRFARVWRQTDSDSQLPVLRSLGEGGSALSSQLVCQLLPGDTLCFLAGKVPHHGGLMLPGGEFLHTLKRRGVHALRLDAVLRGWRVLGYLAAVYRPLPVESALSPQLSALSLP